MLQYEPMSNPLIAPKADPRDELEAQLEQRDAYIRELSRRSGQRTYSQAARTIDATRATGRDLVKEARAPELTPDATPNPAHARPPTGSLRTMYMWRIFRIKTGPA